MRIVETPSRLVVRDTPHAMWVLGVVFVATGSFVLSIPFWSADWLAFGPWQRLAVIAIGLGHLAGGVLSTMQLAATQTELDRATGRGTQRVRRLWRRAAQTVQFLLGEARGVEVVRLKDNDDDPMFQLRLWLAESRWVWLQAQPVYGETQALQEAARLRRFLGLTPADSARERTRPASPSIRHP